MVEELEPVEIGGLRLEHPVMNGAGPFKTLEWVKDLAQSEVAAIVFGSITLAKREENPGRNYYFDPVRNFSINSKGLPNEGLEIAKTLLPEMIQISHDHGKPFIVNVSGFSPKEYAILATAIAESGADGVQLNLGCPNVWGTDGKQKKIASFDPGLTEEILQKVEKEIGTSFWTDVKLSPFSDPHQLMVIAAVLANSAIVKVVTTSNTFPNASAFDDQGNKAIDPAEGLGGLGGALMKQVGLGQVQQLRTLLPSRIDIIGIGGISERRDVDEYIEKGATAVQITTALIQIGPSIFAKVLGVE